MIMMNDDDDDDDDGKGVVYFCFCCIRQMLGSWSNKIYVFYSSNYKCVKLLISSSNIMTWKSPKTVW